jgi:hypothetical protein
VTVETSQSATQPNIGERTIDAATDAARTITELSQGLRAAVDRLSSAIAASRRPGGTLSTISAITREAPLASLFVHSCSGLGLHGAVRSCETGD